jgi:hypothetical protein
MGLDEGSANSQSHAHPTGTRAEVCIENPVQGPVVNPLPIVDHGEFDTAGFGPAARNLSITAGKLAGKLLVESGHADPVSRHP